METCTPGSAGGSQKPTGGNPSRALRPDPTLATHMGFANVTGRTDQAMTHLQAVTGMTNDQAHAHVAAAARRWIAQSGRTWALDLSMLTDAGVTPAPPEKPATRAEAARRQL